MTSDIDDASVSRRTLSLTSLFERALTTSNTELANGIAMAAAEELLSQGSGSARTYLWKKFFSKLTEHYGAQYQSYDFEIVDYKLYRALPLIRLARGPQPELYKLVKQHYVTLFGAAQLFGRYRQDGPHKILEDKLDIAGLNLSMGGAGPEYFSRKRFKEVANGGKALILQVLSGRSIGCDEYPGGRFTQRKGEETKIDRIKLLTGIWEESRDEAIRLILKWQQNYLSMFEGLVAEIDVPIVLSWISDRTPDAWSIDKAAEEPDFGRFPHLVDRKMMNAMAAHCAAVVEVVEDPGLPHGFTSRFTGEKCPCFRPSGKLFWENVYYPSEMASTEIGQKISNALSMLNIAR